MKNVNYNGSMLPVLTVRQIIGLTQAVRERDRERLVKDLEDSGVDPDVRLKALQEHAQKGDAPEYLLRHALTYEGCCEIIEAAGGKVQELSGEDFYTHMRRTAVALVGIDPDEVFKRTEGDDETDPTRRRRSTGTPTLA